MRRHHIRHLAPRAVSDDCCSYSLGKVEAIESQCFVVRIASVTCVIIQTSYRRERSSGTLVSREVKAWRHVSSAYDVGEPHGANEADLRRFRRLFVSNE